MGRRIRHRPARRRLHRRAGLTLLPLLLLLGLPALAEPGAGERAFQKCFSCHSVEKDETGLPGPSLFGIVGRRAAGAPDFEYSPAMRAKGAAGLVWTGANQPPAQSRASWIVLLVGIGAGVVGWIRLWRH